VFHLSQDGKQPVDVVGHLGVAGSELRQGRLFATPVSPEQLLGHLVEQNFLCGIAGAPEENRLRHWAGAHRRQRIEGLSSPLYDETALALVESRPHSLL
jgi:hypothetical protein